MFQAVTNVVNHRQLNIVVFFSRVFFLKFEVQHALALLKRNLLKILSIS